MAIVYVTLDESAGLQNSTATAGIAGDADDNDILVTSLPLIFSARLNVLGANTATALGAALSGYTGAVGDTGSNAFSVTPAPGANVIDVSFTDSTGAPLNGLDSGLDTLDGTNILLYTDSNNNILLGRAGGPNGAIVFAAYIEETGSPVSGGKLWMVQYLPLKHLDPNDPDDALNLLNKVFIGTSQDLEFSLANAPSGQNLFLMFTQANPLTYDDSGVTRISSPSIIATGKDPANQSTGVNINTGARQDVTIPNLDQNEADVEANIDFTAMFNARSAQFDVVQLQSGKTAQVKISAFSTAAEPGVNFVDGYANDTAVAITSVRVINIATGLVIETSDGSVNDPGITIGIVGGVAMLTGIKAGHRIEYTTSVDHNRVLVENGAALDAKGNNHADFDIGGFMLRQVSTTVTEVGSQMIFEDDGPTLAFGNLVGTGTTLAQFGYWNMAAGTDGLGASGLDISLVNGQFTLVRPDGTTTTGSGTLTELSPSPDGSGAFRFAGQLTGDFDDNPATANTTIDYTLTAFANGTYALDLVQGFSSMIVRSSADGALAAGGPDPVRTLLIPPQNPPTIPSPSEEIVFFGVNATTSAADILDAIGPGAVDLTEAQVEAGGFAFLGTANMNVSTSGIGIGNNNLNGNSTAGINAGDESFVVNPESLLTSLKVFIDNSVGGYTPTTEELYYRIFYEDGSVSAQKLVGAADLKPAPNAQYGLGVNVVFFEINKEGSELIDAVQLTMGKGVIKIPVIQFIQETESLASDIRLAFNATLTDGDGDTATSTFAADLFANDPADPLFDFRLLGTLGERDAFNIDLSVAQNLYQVTGFDANASPGLRDTLVLIGDAGVDPTTDINIDNVGADSIVTVIETGGQTTTITVVGVDLLASDIVIA